MPEGPKENGGDVAPAVGRNEGSFTWRDWTPSRRERDGDNALERAPASRAEVVPPASSNNRRDRGVMAQLRQLDPRGIAEGTSALPLILLGLLNTVGTFDNLAFGFLLIFIKADMGFDFQFLFTVQSLLGIVAVVTSPLGGYLADRVKRVWMVRIGTLIDNLSTIVSGFAPGPGLLVASRIVGGLGPAIYSPAIPPLMADYFPVHKRARVFGFMHMIALVWGLIAGVLLFVSLVYWGVSWRTLLIASGALATLVSIGTFALKEPLRGEVDRLALGASAEAAREEQAPASWAEAWRISRSIGSLRKLWYATPFITVSSTGIALFLFFAVQERLAFRPQGLMSDPTVQRFLPLFFIIFPSLIGALMTPAAVSVADRLLAHRPGRIMYYAGAVQAGQAAAVIGILFIPDLLVAFILSFVIGALGGLLAPARSTLLSVVIPARIRAQGFQTVAPWTLAGLVILPILGALADEAGPTAGVIGLVPVMLIGAAILMSSGVDVEADMRAALAASAAGEEALASRLRGSAKLIVCRDLDVSYEGARVLRNVDFDVEEGDLVAIVGTNGAGKSTLLRAIAGIHEASNGAIFLDGEDITHKPPHHNARDGIVFLPGGRAIFPTLSVDENLRAAATLYGDDPEYITGRQEEVLDLFPILRERHSELAGNLSGGEQQMLALAQAFLMKPRLLMIDELSLGLAPAVVELLLDVVRKIHDQGTTVLLVEQSINVAMTIAERAVFMEKGGISFDGPTSELLGRSDLVRAVFLGSVIPGLGPRASSRKKAYGEKPQVLLGARDVHLRYGGVQALSGVDLEVLSEQVVGIIGPNGAGKTSLFDVISGFVKPDSGSIEIDGTNVVDLSPDARARLGLARSFQNTRLFTSLTVRESIATALEGRVKSRSAVLAAAWSPGTRRSERSVFRRVAHLIEMLGLETYADAFVNELSTGTRRMVEIACILGADPKIVLLDEPSSGMAQSETETLAPAIRRLVKGTGCGVLIIEHDIPLISAVADELVAMDLGKVLTTGVPDEVLTDPRVVASYLNASQSVIQRSGDLVRAVTETLTTDGSTADAVSKVEGESRR